MMSMFSRRLKSLYVLNVGSSYVQVGGRILVLALVTPYLINTLGQSRYGTWVLLNSIIGYFEIAEFGLFNTLIMRLPGLRARGDRATASHMISTTFFGLLGLLGFLSIAIVGAEPFLARVFNVAQGMEHEASITFLAVYLGFMASLLKRVFDTVIVASEKIYLVNFLNTAYVVTYGIGFFIVIQSGGSLLGMAMTQALVSTVFLVVSLGVSRRIGSYDLSWRLWRRDVLREMLTPSVYFFVAGVSAVIIYNSDNLVISAAIGPAAVAVYSVAYRFVQTLHYMIGKLTDVLFPRLSYLFGQGRLEEMRTIWWRSMALTSAVTFAAATGLWLWGYTFLAWWFGAANVVARPVYDLCVAFFIIQNLGRASGNFIWAMGIHKPVAIVAVLEAVVNLVLSLILVSSMGVYGVALATLVTHTLTSGWFLHFHLWRHLFRRRGQVDTVLLAKTKIPAAAAVSQ